MILPLVLFVAFQGPEPLLRTHAHNDYEHTRPLLDALDQGFCSVEADIYLVDGELLVGHDRKDLVPGKTLEKLYLDPLMERVKAHHGHVYEKKAPVILLVDIKTDGEAVYAELRKRLPKYRKMLTEYKESDSATPVKARAITVILSGDRPIETLKKEKQRFAFIDGRLTDLGEATLDTNLIPLVSDDYFATFKWPGYGGDMPADQAMKLKAMVEKAHTAGAKIRFWATPDTPSMWKTMYDAGVDLLNTDNLPGLAAFLRSKQ